MTERDFRIIATAIRMARKASANTDDRRIIDNVVAELSIALGGTNATFNAEMFWAACQEEGSDR